MQRNHRIAVLGIGFMGAPMARRLLAAGYEVGVWNRTLAKAEALAGDGARIADTPAEAAADADIVITMLEHGAAVTETLFGRGVAESLKPGGLVADMSSVPPSLARDHAERLAEAECRHLDAPVSGGTRGAAEGSLAIMVGGDGDAFEEARPVFEVMGRPTLVGPHGAGQLAKLANQAIVGITIGAVSEALLLVAAGGADPAAVREAIRGGFADSRILSEHGARMIERNWVPGAPSRIQLKDLDTIMATARELGLSLPLTENIRERYADMTERRDLGDLDHAALLLHLEAGNAPHRLGKAPDRMPV